MPRPQGSLPQIFVALVASAGDHNGKRVNPLELGALNITDLVRFLQHVFGNLHGLCLRASAPLATPHRSGWGLPARLCDGALQVVRVALHYWGLRVAPGGLPVGNDAQHDLELPRPH